MRLDNERPSDNVEDRRSEGGSGGGFGLPGGGRQINFPMGGRGGGFSLSTIVIMAILYFALKFIFGIDILGSLTGGGGGMQVPGQDTQIQMPDTQVTDAGSANVPGGAVTNGNDVTGDAGKDFVARVLGSTERVWDANFKAMGQTYEKPVLVLFNGFVQSACGMAQSAMGPFYCPRDHKLYIDLSFYQDMKTKLGAPGDAAQGYVVAHEVGHHVQNLLGIADKVEAARRQASETESNALSVRMELQADCLAGVWANESGIFESGDAQEALNAANQIGDDRLQKRSQGYAVPDSFTHGTSEQRARWFSNGMKAKTLQDCNTFSTDNL